MAKVKVELDRDMRTVSSMTGLDHIVINDAPTAIGGLGEHMSPTDLFGASLGACILTMMGLKAKQLKVDLTGATVEVAKRMASDPTLRVAGFRIAVQIPHAVDIEQQKQLEDAARHCPIHLSLGENVQQEITFTWG